MCRHACQSAMHLERSHGVAGIGAMLAAGMRLSRSFALPAPPFPRKFLRTRAPLKRLEPTMRGERSMSIGRSRPWCVPGATLAGWARTLTGGLTSPARLVRFFAVMLRTSTPLGCRQRLGYFPLASPSRRNWISCWRRRDSADPGGAIARSVSRGCAALSGTLTARSRAARCWASRISV